jgi:hypothetical protein
VLVDEFFMTVESVEIRVKGVDQMVPAVTIAGRTVLATGKWIKTAAIRDQESAEGELVKDPQTFLADLKSSGLKADVFTFFQRPPDVTPRHPYRFDWQNYAAVPITTFNEWWESLPQEARKNTRRSAKRGVTVKVVPFDDELVRGIHALCNETPVRQGRPFWHYGKDFETIKRLHATYLERSDFIGAYFENKLIGFIKLVYVDRLALIFHILAFNDHYDKRPMNALITKAMEVCAQKGVGYFVYGQYVYGNKSQSSLVEFKRRNGFQQIDFPTYYIPLTWKGRIYCALRLYRGAVGLLPEPVLRRLLAVRDWVNEKRAGSAPAKNEEAAEKS